MEKNCCCNHRTRVRNDDEMKKLLNRLSRVEGQVRGVRKMLEEDAYCIDIVNQVSAVTSALNSFTAEILTQHFETCVKDDLAEGNDEKLIEAITALKRII